VRYPSKPDTKSKWDGKTGTLAIMADGKVRFIPEDIPAATFRALCTIAGGEKIDKLDEIAPVIVDETERVLKTDGGDLGGKVPAEVLKGGDLEKMQGTWAPVSVSARGVPLPGEALKTVRLSISGNTLSISGGGPTQRASITLDPSKTPKVFDTVDLDGPQRGQKALGIYELTAKQLKICIQQGGTTRPTTFSATPENKQTVMVLERATGPAPVVKDDWQDRTPPSKAFTVKLPRPMVEIKPPSVPGVQPPAMYVSVGSKAAFSIAVRDLIPAEVKAGAEQGLAQAKSAILQNPNRKVESEEKITLGGNPGREWTVSITGQGKRKMRAYVVGNRFFVLEAGFVTKESEKDIKTFFDSFRANTK